MVDVSSVLYQGQLKTLDDLAAELSNSKDELAAVREENEAKVSELENRLADAFEKVDDLDSLVQEKEAKLQELSSKVRPVMMFMDCSERVSQAIVGS